MFQQGAKDGTLAATKKGPEKKVSVFMRRRILVGNLDDLCENWPPVKFVQPLLQRDANALKRVVV
jgi:hypothetical protein